MGLETADDLALFLSPDEFGTAATYRKRATVLDLSIEGIFDAERSVGSIGEGADIASVSPQLLVRTADLPAGAGDGDLVTISAVAYTVRFLEPDGTGMTLIKLEKN